MNPIGTAQKQSFPLRRTLRDELADPKPMGEKGPAIYLAGRAQGAHFLFLVRSDASEVVVACGHFGPLCAGGEVEKYTETGKSERGRGKLR